VVRGLPPSAYLAEFLEQPPGVPPVASGAPNHRAGASATVAEPMR
jgi:hypothetical protein